MAKAVRWGICGSGRICNDFAAALHSLDYPITAVAASTLAKAEKFQATVPRIARAYGNYAELAVDPEVDVVYIGTVHSCHVEHALLMIAHGKHVLCEKPITLNMRDTTKIIEAARAKKVFFLEGMWTRFFPAIRKVKQLLVDKTVGDPVLFQADFGFKADAAAAPRLFDPAVGGGAGLDIGIYPIAAASLAFGGATPTSVKATGILGATNVDEQGVLALQYPSGSASLTWTILAQTPEECTYICTDGHIKVASPAHAPTKVIVTRCAGRGGGEVEEFDFPLPTNTGPGLIFPNSEGFQYEATAVAETIAAGKLECEEYPIEETLTIQGILDAYRKELGLVYPADA